MDQRIRGGGGRVDIAAWLDGLGLQRYEEAFRGNHIGRELLATLTSDDLREMGVASLGHRKQLLAAIAALPGTADAPPPPRVARPAERRQLTIMFVDLVGSTALSQRLDPEEMGEVLHSYQDVVARAVSSFQGQIAKFLGDGVLVYFGWPRAHEDDAERAVRAGLAIVHAMASERTPDGEPLAARVGIATGLAVVGEIIGEGQSREETVVGETPNLAARLQALADPGTVVIGLSTRRLVGGLFELADLGAHDLKGFAEPVPAWQVLRPSSDVEGRFAAREAAGLTPLVGRVPEMKLLLDCWQQAKRGSGRVVLLSGEAGVGKSRLVWALREHLRNETFTALNFQCSPHHAQSALWPVIELLERRAGYRGEDSRRYQALEA